MNTSVSLNFWGPDLDPDVVSRALGCEPDHTLVRGRPIRPGRAGTAPHGGWRVGEEGGENSDPVRGVNLLAERLRARLPADLPARVARVRERTDVRQVFLRVVFHGSYTFDVSTAAFGDLLTVADGMTIVTFDRP